MSSARRAPAYYCASIVEEALTQLRDLMPESFHGAWEVEIAAGHPAETIVRVAQERLERRSRR